MAAIGQASEAWRNTMLEFKYRIFEHASWALGALAIGVGVLPVLLGVAALARPGSETRDPRTRAFITTSVAALVVFVMYAGIKGAYNSTVFSTLVVERNLIYLCPILFISTALAFARGVGRGWAIAGATILTLWVITIVPLRLDQYPYYEAHGLAIATFFNRELSWSESVIQGVLIAVCVLSLLVVLALRLLRRGSTGFAAVAGVTAVAVVAWGLTGQVYAAEGERRHLRAGRRKPAATLRLGRGSDRGRIRRRARPGDHRCDRYLAHRVLQPLRSKDVEPRRLRDRTSAGRS